eukprot:TRINITY_DN6860_c0_g1_i1.p1 TRINITY_DN6860_c0_g1~~TRINITY_DN6860_c0_g1_i1.p1  ORF type:complete len:655 (+),score=108.21 TRINITY_DN6860_c0_g1_i1:284-1966(+)
MKEKARELLDNPRSCTGVLESLPTARDLKIDKFSLALHGIELISDTRLEFNFGRRYGLIGLNGTGKSTMMKCLGHREVPIPAHIDTFFVDGEVEGTDKTAIEAVFDKVDLERQRLEKEAEDLTTSDVDDVGDRLNDIYERLDGMDSKTAEARAARILHGLGFTAEMQRKKTREFSGGWRMRIALAQALFVRPTMLLLDEPTNHLDLEACVWLEEYLKSYPRILLLVSHSQDFLNGVCTNIINLKNKQLTYYNGNYDTYVQAKEELEVNQMKRYNWEQDQIAHMKDYIARFGHGSAKLARQAQSKEKVLAKMIDKGLTEKVVAERVLNLSFYDVGTLPPPVLQFHDVSFGYTKSGPVLYRNLDFGIDLESRVALVGPNGVGKSTLLKLMCGELEPLDGMVKRNNRLRVGVYRQHLMDQLDPQISPLEYMMQQYPEIKEKEEMRRIIGKFGLTGAAQTQPIRLLSDGHKSRVVFAWLAWKEPHLLLLDEPTNHLDIETIDSLAAAINAWDGGMVLVSHDFRLINQVAKEIWVCENQTVTPYRGTIESYKELLKTKLHGEDAF